MGASMLVMIREGFEAALIVAIVLAYLRRIERVDLMRPVWIGVGSAAAIAFAFGVGIHLSIGELTGPARLRAFTAISITAVIVLTWMVFWMKKQGRAQKSDLEHKVDAALASHATSRGLVLVAFFAVLREGIEAALFLIAAATNADGRDVLIGGLIGLTLSAMLGFAVYLGGAKIPMQTFFKVTGLIVILFAAGLCAKTVMFLQAAGDLSSANWALYNLTGFHALTEASQSGRFLSALVGWDPRPSIEQFGAWLLYIVPVTYLFLRDPAPARAPRPVSGRVPADAALVGEPISR